MTEQQKILRRFKKTSYLTGIALIKSAKLPDIAVTALVVKGKDAKSAGVWSIHPDDMKRYFRGYCLVPLTPPIFDREKFFKFSEDKSRVYGFDYVIFPQVCTN